MGDIGILFDIIKVLAFIAFFWFLAFIYSYFSHSSNKFKTNVKPKITWELKASGQKVDTIWIYEFNSK